MRLTKILSIFTLIAAAVLIAASNANSVSARGRSEAAKAARPGNSTIVGIVVANDNFDVLKTAVVKAGLADVLNGRGQYTVFAPTDNAFISTFEGLLGVPLSEQQVIDFINSGGVDQALGEGSLVNILLYHVTEGRRISTSVLAAPQYQMLNGGVLSRDTLSDAGIVATDISASNGIIHVINSVLLP